MKTKWGFREQPEIARTEETGYPFPRARRECYACGCGIRPEEAYFLVEGRSFCPECIRERLHYA